MLKITILIISFVFSLNAFSSSSPIATEITGSLKHSLNTSLTSVSNFSLQKKYMFATRGTFVFDPNRLEWRAYDASGRLIRSGRASGGKGYCPDVRRRCRTPSGRFKIYTRRGANCVSSKYPLNKRKPRARMPYCSFFYRGFAIHGSNNVPNHNASHGCIRVRPNDAKWLYYNFLFPGTKVIVKPYRR